MALDKQMEMFDDGGLMDEGGTVDPVSGNDVPPGSTQEEVRDDIPAQLSEGEFVFPADVVRYIGLGNLMRMRQEAKMGLKLMEEMGQMGNSEEATMPDDVPFDIDDLDMEDEDEYNTPQEFAVGGMPTPNPNTGVYYNPAATPTTGVAAAPTQAASQQFVQPAQPQQAAVPTMQAYQPAQVPTFEGFVGQNIPGVDFEYVDYTNEAGNVIKLRKSKSTGQLLDPVPEGYSYVDPEATKTEEVTTTPTTPQTTSVRDDSGDDEARRREEEEMYGPGGARLGFKDFGGQGKDTIYGLSFNNMGGFGGTAGAFQIASGKIPDDAEVTFKNGDDVFTVTGEEYKGIKKEVEEEGTDYSYFRKVREEARKRQEVKEDIARQTKALDTYLETNYKTKDEKDEALTQFVTDMYENVTDFSFGEEDSSSDSSDSTSDDSYDDYAESFSAIDNFNYGFKDGGLASKSKPKKTKKMKKGGLASKK